jgi:ketosteroid isomerase-like protein
VPVGNNALDFRIQIFNSSWHCCQLFRHRFALQALCEVQRNQTCATSFMSLSNAKGVQFMKHSLPHLAITFALLSFTFGQAPARQESEKSKSEQEIRQMIEKYRTALLQRDIAALEKIWAEDYVFVNASGDVLTKTQRLANVKSGETTLESIKEEENLAVRVCQNSAVATSRVTIKGQYSGQPTSSQYRSTHVWVKGTAGCQLVSNQLTALPPK